MNKNYKRMVIICVIFLFIPFIGNSVSQASSIELPFKQELKIPVDTTKARYQPIDMHIFFKHPCWAKNETLHSVRVYYDDGTGLTEIESQIYELEFFDDSHIKACNLVFLIPGEANGKEKYYVLYDDSETPPPNYPDHLIVEDTHYFYEPISGQKMDFDYYKIIEDGYIIYGICQKGVLLGEGVSHTIIKLKPNSTEFETKNADQFASFAMSYAIDGPKQYSGSPRAEVVHKSILVDGNLMIRVRIESTSPEGVIKTSAVYSYYYCPTSMKRIAVHVNHRVLETVEVRGDRERDGTYASLSTFKSRSATIENMNVGNILPSLHVYGEDDTIKEYSIPVNPESHKPEWILSTSDDVDLGSKAWLCIDDPSTGKAHALIFQSNRGLLNGEKDGIQVKSSVRQVVKLPGLEADGGSLFATRNTYEKGGEHDLILPKGMNVTFNAEFVTTEKGDYEVIDRESEIFQKLICYRPITIDNESAEKEKKRYTLTTYVHFAPSFPLGSTLSAVLGKNFSYLYAEVYKEESLTSSGSVGRLPLSENMEFNLKNTSLLQKVKIITDLFDWKNTSLFKKIRFPNLEEGKYLVRVYRENPLFGRERQYIGFGIIDVRENTSLHIFCRSEGKLQTSITNQNGKGIKQVKILLLREETVVAETTTDDNGSAILKAPSLPFRPYKLQVIYQGFLVKEKDLRLGLLRHFLPLKEKFILLLYQLKLQVKDSWGLTPDIDVHPILTSNEMIEPISIKAERKNNGEYIFSNLYPADYTLKISYKSFLIEKRISIDKDDTLKLTFPAEFTVDFDILNVYGMQLNNGKLILIRGGRQIEAEIERSG
ncbi:MAG TPA: carboxypeptidase regulatory-like domain-containing protein, partial [Thermoplasmatales archaeon]|nr:carboxypeptidase regulatory-like domain-containing protein [Thermoplasmatales archaeon]